MPMASRSAGWEAADETWWTTFYSFRSGPCSGASRRAAPSLRSSRLVRIDFPPILNMYVCCTPKRVPVFQSLHAVSKRGSYSVLLYQERSRFWSRLKFWRPTGLAQLHKNAVDIGSPQKCAAVRRRRWIGEHGVKTEGRKSIQPPLAADILGASRS
jgi:hypothetical protein